MSDRPRVKEMRGLLVEAESLRTQFNGSPGAPFLEQTIRELRQDIVDIARMESEITMKKAWLKARCEA